MGDIIDWPGFLSKLSSAGKAAQPSPGKRIWELLPQDIRSTVEESVASSSSQEEQKSNIIKALNERILDSRDFYQERYFSSITIPEEAQRLLSNRANLSSSDVQRLNRLLIESAYPHEIAKSQMFLLLHDSDAILSNTVFRSGKKKPYKLSFCPIPRQDLLESS